MCFKSKKVKNEWVPLDAPWYSVRKSAIDRIEIKQVVKRRTCTKYYAHIIMKKELNDPFSPYSLYFTNIDLTNKNSHIRWVLEFIDKEELK